MEHIFSPSEAIDEKKKKDTRKKTFTKGFIATLIIFNLIPAFLLYLQIYVVGLERLKFEYEVETDREVINIIVPQSFASWGAAAFFFATISFFVELIEDKHAKKFMPAHEAIMLRFKNPGDQLSVHHPGRYGFSIGAFLAATIQIIAASILAQVM